MARTDAGPSSEPPELPRPSGGLGGRSGQTRDVRLFAAAVSQSWDVPQAMRAKVVARLGAVIDDPDSKPRAVATAARCLLSMTTATVAALQAASQIRAADELAGQVAELKARLEELAGSANP